MECNMTHLIQNPSRAASTTGTKTLWRCSSYKSSSSSSSLNSFSLTPARSSRETEPEPDDGRRQLMRASVRRTPSARIDKPTPRDAAALGAVRVAFNSEVVLNGANRCLSRKRLALFVICLVTFASIHVRVLVAKPIEDPASLTNATATGGRQLGADLKPQAEQLPTLSKNQAEIKKSNETSRAISIEALTDLIDRVTSAFTASKSTEPTTTTSTTTTTETSTTTLIATTPTPIATTEEVRRESSGNLTESKTDLITETTTAATTTTTTSTTSSSDYDDDNDSPGARNDDHNAEDCQGLSSGATAPGAGPSDNERLVNLQTCLQKKVKKLLTGSVRSSMELFERLSLSGACSASLMGLVSSLGELKGFAFKFLDASAKIPSGMMSGLLSDFGDFEQCLAIRSNPAIDPQLEEEEGSYSGKYCMLNIKMRYHVQLGPNSSAPEGIYPDGVLWDELVRNYWTSNANKGFQVGVCVPSRCNQDDLEQMFQLFAESYHFYGEIGACQDSNNVRRQQEPDALQWTILCAFTGVLLMNLIGTIVDLYLLKRPVQTTDRLQVATCSPLQLVACFSIRRNWLVFLHGQRSPVMSKLLHWHSKPVEESRNSNRERRPLVMSSDSENSSNGSGSSSSATNTLISSSSFCSSIPESTLSCEISSIKDQRSSPYKRLEQCQRPPTNQPLAIKTNVGTNAVSGHANAHLAPGQWEAPEDSLSHLHGIKLIVIIWITIGHSFLYPSANNYQHYRSIINMAITRTSVWFATTNFILGIDMLLYVTGLLFVHKLAAGKGRTWSTSNNNNNNNNNSKHRQATPLMSVRIGRLILGKVLRLWPVYLSVIALAIVTPLVSNGPMWPEVVTKRLGETCRANWWANLLMVNNFFEPSRVCLPSSWFISVVMQCFLIGSLVMMVANWRSMRVAAALASLLIVASSSIVFWLAHSNKLNAPAIRMDESFVMELDEHIFKMYTSTLSNLGPFLIGMLGGFVLLWHQTTCSTTTCSIDKRANEQQDDSEQLGRRKLPKIELISDLMFELNMAFAMLLIALVVLSSVFFTSYTPFWSAMYWSCHRIGWAIVTGYLIHQCATGKWQLLKQLLSLDSFIPMTRLIFLAYLVHPMFIHIHSGLVRDGLHVSLYNMLNIYISRLVMTFTLALALHLLVELPICIIEERILDSCLDRRRLRNRRKKWLQSGGGRNSGGPQGAHNKTLYAATPSATDGPNLDGPPTSGPLLVIAIKGKTLEGAKNPLATFSRQHTTESTLSNSSD